MSRKYQDARCQMPPEQRGPPMLVLACTVRGSRPVDAWLGRDGPACGRLHKCYVKWIFAAFLFYPPAPWQRSVTCSSQIGLTFLTINNSKICAITATAIQVRKTSDHSERA